MNYYNFSVDLGKEDAQDTSSRLREFASQFGISGGLEITFERGDYRVCLRTEKELRRCFIERRARVDIKDFNSAVGKN